MSRDTYLLDIKKAFPTFEKEEIEYYYRITNSIIEETKDNEDYNFYVSRFGSPIEIVEAFYGSLETQVIYTRMKNKKQKQKSLKLIFLFLMISTIIFSCFLHSTREDAKDSIGSYFDEPTITYE